MEFVPILMLVAVLLVSRYFGKKSSEGITDEQKEKIIIELVVVRKIFLMPIIIFFVTYAISIYRLHVDNLTINRYFFPILAVLLGAIYFVSYTRLKKLELGDNFKKNYLLSKVIIMAGVVAFMVLVFVFPPAGMSKL